MNNAGIHIHPNSFRVSSGEVRKGNFVDYRQNLLSGPLAGLTAVGDANMLEHLAKDWLPYMPASSSVVGRITAVEDWLKDKWAKSDARTLAKTWATNLYDALRVSPYHEQTRRRVYYQHKDETLGDWEWQAEFEVAAVGHLQALGINYAGLCLFTGNPPMKKFGDPIDGWDILWPAVVAVVQAGGKISLHTYIETTKPLVFQEQQYHALRVFDLCDRLRRAQLKGRIVISETGTYLPWRYAQVSDYNALANTLIWMYDQYQKYPEVESINDYDCSLIGDGVEDWLVPPEVVQMIPRYNQEHVGSVPPPAPVPTPVPVPTPSPVPTPEPVLRNSTTKADTYIRATPEMRSDLSNLVTTLATNAKVAVKDQPLIGGYVKAYLSDKEKEVGWIYKNNVR